MLTIDREKSNLGGINQIQFITEGNLSEKIEIVKGQVSTIQINFPDWYNIDIVQDSCKFIEDKKNINLFEYKITAKIAKDAYEMLDSCILLDSSKIVAIILDNNNKQRLIGNKYNACEISINFDKGQNVADLNHYMIEFKWLSMYRAAFVSENFVQPQFFKFEEGNYFLFE